MQRGDLKHYVSELSGKPHLFRGQRQPWRLRTTFHCTGQADLIRFVTEDIQYLHRHLSARPRHIFNLGTLRKTVHSLILFNTMGIRHLFLDWTYSP
jgi:hypothetical protein